MPLTTILCLCLMQNLVLSNFVLNKKKISLLFIEFRLMGFDCNLNDLISNYFLQKPIVFIVKLYWNLKGILNILLFNNFKIAPLSNYFWDKRQKFFQMKQIILRNIFFEEYCIKKWNFKICQCNRYMQKKN